jgi:hypothetical protein
MVRGAVSVVFQEAQEAPPVESETAARRALTIGLSAIVGIAFALLLVSLAWGQGNDPEEPFHNRPVDDAIQHAADANGLSRGFLYCLAQKESGEDLEPPPPGAGFYQGLFQFDPQTWKTQSPRFGFADFSPYHLWANAHVAAGLIAELGQTEAMYQQWPPARRCGPIRLPATPTPSPTPYKDLNLG